MNRRLGIIFLVAILICFYFISCLNSSERCSKLKEGTFYYYSPGHENDMVIIRKDSLQSEINIRTGDTSNWRIKWITDCQFSSHYLSGIKFATKSDEYFYRTSTITFTIGTITKDYFLYDALFENEYSRKKYSDTCWLHERKINN